MAMKVHGKTVQEAMNINTFVDPAECKSFVTSSVKQVGLWGTEEEWHSLRCLNRGAVSSSAWPWGLSTSLGGVTAQSGSANPFTTTAARLNMTAFDPVTEPTVLTIGAGETGMDSIGDFPETGTLYLVSYLADVAYIHYITYTGKGLNTFTGCSGWNQDAAGEDIDDDSVVSLYKNPDGTYPEAAPLKISLNLTTTSTTYGVAVKVNDPLGMNVQWKIPNIEAPMVFTPSIRVHDIFFACTTSLGNDTGTTTTTRGVSFNIYY